jgi:hypothetical protein
MLGEYGIRDVSCDDLRRSFVIGTKFNWAGTFTHLDETLEQPTWPEDHARWSKADR